LIDGSYYNYVRKGGCEDGRKEVNMKYEVLKEIVEKKPTPKRLSPPSSQRF